MVDREEPRPRILRHAVIGRDRIMRGPLRLWSTGTWSWLSSAAATFARFKQRRLATSIPPRFSAEKRMTRESNTLAVS